MPPCSIEAEEGLIRDLFSGSEIEVAVSEGLKASDFYITQNGWVYQAMVDIHTAGQELTFIMVCERLKQVGQLEQLSRDGITGEFALASLAKAYTLYDTSKTVRSYAQIIKDKALRRTALAQASLLAQAAYDESTALHIHLSRHERAMTALKPVDLNQEFVFGSKAQTIYDDMLAELARGQHWYPMPWDSLAERVPCVVDGDLIVVVGPEGSGKSALLLNWAQFNGTQNIRTVYIHTEMNRKAVFDRHVLATSKAISNRHLQKPEELTDAEWSALYQEDMLKSWSPALDFWHCGLVEESKLFATMQRMVDDFGTKWFIIDYLNDVVPDRDPGGNSANGWRNFLARCENFNNKNHTVILTAAQLNDQGNAYMIGKALRQKAMLFLRLKPDVLEYEHSFEYDGVPYQYVPGDYHPVIPMHVEKYRSGGRGVVPLLFVGPRYLWVDQPKEFQRTRNYVQGIDNDR
jgi:replicative DNA helicase